MMHPLLNGMNEKQSEAVRTTEGPLLIMAGAGSGKTRVLTHRIAYLIDEKFVNPWNILAITFTNIASNSGKSGYLTLINSSAYAFTAHTNTKIAATDLTKIGATGIYIMPYMCGKTDVFILGAWKKP